MIKQDSLRKRYFYKVFANFILVAAGAVVQAIIPRGLGVAQYGNFNFLTDFFMQFLNFLNMGTSVAFYTKISKRPHESKLVSFYFSYILGAIVFALLIVLAVVCFHWQGWVWPGQTTKYIFAAVIFAAFNWLFNSMNDTMDAYGLTVAAERVKVIQRLLGIVFILFLLHYGWIRMGTIFGLNYAIFGIAIIAFIYVGNKFGKDIHLEKLTGKEIRGYFVEFYQYSKPLFSNTLLALCVGIFDRWFLQVSAGSEQQGFYSLSFKIGIICFFLTSAMTQLLTREFSIAYERNELKEMARLFRRHIPLLYGITAIISAFMFVNADKMAIIMGGKEFKAAVIPVAIMALFPIHQTYGQLSSAVFYAANQTRLLCKVTNVFLLIALPCTYFLLASPSHYGLGMGAVGLALKMVFFNIAINNTLLYFNSKFLKIPFWWYIKHQVLSVSTFILLAFLLSKSVDFFFPLESILPRFLSIGAIYMVLIFAVVFMFPGLLGLTHEDISILRNRVRSRLKFL